VVVALQVKLTISAFANELGRSPATVRSGLLRNGVDIKHGGTDGFTLKELIDALYGDETAARIAVDQERAEKLRLANAEARRELVPMGEAEAMIRSTLLPVRDLLLSAPAVLAARVNPTDPEHARSQIQSWVDNGLKTIREEIK
jgi:hypothetical protein